MKPEVVRSFPSPEQVAASIPLLDRAYELQFDPDRPPLSDEICLKLGEFPVGARGNLSCIQGKSKVGKSAVVSSILGAALRGTRVADGDTLQFRWTGDTNGAVVHLDTEQSPSDWHGLVGRSVARSGLSTPFDRLVSLPLVMFTRAERLTLLRQVLEHEAGLKGGIDAVLIDGIADLCLSPNDEAEALQLVSEVHALSHRYKCPILSVLHENPGTDAGKTRGHLGSELNRKAFANLRVDKNQNTSISTLWGTDMRKREIPRAQGFCFAWDDEVGMHTFQGRAAGLAATLKDAAKAAKEREFFRPIFDANGTNTSCPVLSVADALRTLRDTNGTEDLPQEGTLKKRMQRAETLGVLRNAGRGVWAFNPNGTNET